VRNILPKIDIFRCEEWDSNPRTPLRDLKSSAYFTRSGSHRNRGGQSLAFLGQPAPRSISSPLIFPSGLLRCKGHTPSRQLIKEHLHEHAPSAHVRVGGAWPRGLPACVSAARSNNAAAAPPGEQTLPKDLHAARSGRGRSGEIGALLADLS
jgi:hypothetical protein